MNTEQAINSQVNAGENVDLVRSINCSSMERNQPKIMASGYQRTREMTLDELMLENRVIFLIGEINQASAARVMMQMLYLESGSGAKKTINPHLVQYLKEKLNI